MARAHKVMLLGEIGVGKSSLAKRLVFGRFNKDYKPTIGVEVYRYDVPAPDEVASTHGPTCLILWDTDGNFGDAIFRHVYIKQAAGAVIVADQSRPETIESMIRLARGFNEVLPGRAVHFVLNKSDLITDGSEVCAMMAQFNASHIAITHTSALTGASVESAFLETAQAIQRRGF